MTWQTLIPILAAMSIRTIFIALCNRVACSRTVFRDGWLVVFAGIFIIFFFFEVFFFFWFWLNKTKLGSIWSAFKDKLSLLLFFVIFGTILDERWPKNKLVFFRTILGGERWLFKI